MARVARLAAVAFLDLACSVTRADAQLPRPEPRRIWAGPEVDLEGGITPDGRLLSFVDWTTGDLALRDLERGESRRVTRKGSWAESGEFAGRSRISPDGEWIAFAWFNREQRYDLRLIRTDGSQLHVLYAGEDVLDIDPWDWSPDGRGVLVSVHGRDGSDRLVLISIIDAAVRELASFPVTAARSSPDGRHIVYEAEGPDGPPNSDLFIFSLDSEAAVRATEGAGRDYGAFWTPDGRAIVFLGDRGGRLSLLRLPVADGHPTGAPEVLIADPGPIRPLGLSREGSLVYAKSAEVRKVYVAELDPVSGDVTKPAVAVSALTEDAYSAPAWSPDGRGLAYVAIRGGPGGYRAFVIWPVAGGAERVLMPRGTSSGRHAPPRWSPDGRFLLFTGCGGFCRIDGRSGEATPVAPEGAQGAFVAWRPVWSPDGREIFFLYEENLAVGQASNRLAALDLETGREREVYRGPVRSLAVSPDGRRVAFWEMDPEDGTTVIKLMPTGGGAARELVRLPPPATMPQLGGLAWSPDGVFILFSRRAATAGARLTELWRVPAAGGEPRRLGLAMEGLGEYGLDVAPDGRSIAFTAGQARAEVWVLQGLAPRAGR